MRCCASYFFWYFIPKLFATRVDFILFLLCHHSLKVVGAGSYPNGHICYLRTVCEIIPAWNRSYIPFSTLTYINPFICLSMRLYL